MSGDTIDGLTAVPQGERPRMFGGHPRPMPLPWRWAEERLSRAPNYWIATTRPGGVPHSRPVWGVWLEHRLYFSTGSLAARNLLDNPEISVNLESGSEVVIVEGTAAHVSDTDVIERVVHRYNAKYNWDMDPLNLPGPLFAVRPRVVFGWLSDDTGLDRGAAFQGTATRWMF